jgi:LSD1 subclass zinc finger protein
LKDFVGALAPNHVKGRPQARLESAAGSAALMLLCGGCGAPLELGSDARLVKCGYCDVLSLIPSRIRTHDGAEIEPTAWWLAFRGPSGVRKTLDQELRQKREKAKAAQERQQRERERRLARVTAETEREERSIASGDSSGRSKAIAVFVATGVLTLVGLGLALILR